MTEAPPRKDRSRRILRLFTNVAIVVVVFAAVMAFQTRNMLATDRQAAPPLAGLTVSGSPYALDASRDRPVLVYFFAPWCKVCAASADNIERLRWLLGEDALDIVTVALDWRDADEVRDYASRHELTGPVVLGDSGVARDWKIYAYPTYYVLDSDHHVARRDMGYSTQLGLLLRVLSVD